MKRFLYLTLGLALFVYGCNEAQPTVPVTEITINAERSASTIVPLKIYQISYKDNAKHFRYMYAGNPAAQS